MNKGLGCLLAGLLLTAMPLRAEESPHAEVYVGKVTTIEVGTVERVAVGNESIVSVTPLDNGEILLLGKSEGVSDVYVWTLGNRLRPFRVRVYAEPQADEVSRIETVLTGFPDVAVNRHLGMTILSGMVDGAQFERFESAIRSFDDVVSLVQPQLNIAIEDSIALDVRILEIDRSVQRQLGIRWADTTAGPAFGAVGVIKPNRNFGVYSESDSAVDLEELLGSVGTGSARLSSFLGITTVFGSEIDLLQEEGAARTLAAPSLSTVSGEPAEFLAGGEIPVAVLNQFGQPVVEFHEFGIRLEVEPVMDRNHNIRARVAARISTVDFSTIVNGVPGFRERSTSSTITARPGDTIVLSGLVNLEDARNADKVPGLGSLPVLGELFRSRGFRKQRTELIVTVTPRIQQRNRPLDGELPVAEEELHKLLPADGELNKALMW